MSHKAIAAVLEQQMVGEIAQLDKEGVGAKLVASMRAMIELKVDEIVNERMSKVDAFVADAMSTESVDKLLGERMKPLVQQIVKNAAIYAFTHVPLKTALGHGIETIDSEVASQNVATTLVLVAMELQKLKAEVQAEKEMQHGFEQLAKMVSTNSSES